MSDLSWMRRNGLEAAVKKLAGEGVPVIGVCGGYQMLGESLHDPNGVEGGGSMRGMELLPVATTFAAHKTRARVGATVGRIEGFFSCLRNAEFAGYEIHMGVGERGPAAAPFSRLRRAGGEADDGAVLGNVMGSYVHGLFDSGSLAGRLAGALLAGKGLAMDAWTPPDHQRYKEEQYDALAEALRGALEVEAVYGIAGL
jgi:adenosylcobyric acid synthase